MTDNSAYGSVTHPERFAPLHEAAAHLVLELEERFDVTVEPVQPQQGHSTARVLSATRLRPANGGAPVVITLTGFPGLFVQFGERYVEPFPQCGCDACDEQPEALIDDLRRKLWSVATGRFEEPAGGSRFTFEDGGSSESVPSQPPRDVSSRTYSAWPPR